jgi:hypothetical protein
MQNNRGYDKNLEYGKNHTQAKLGEGKQIAYKKVEACYSIHINSRCYYAKRYEPK